MDDHRVKSHASEDANKSEKNDDACQVQPKDEPFLSNEEIVELMQLKKDMAKGEMDKCEYISLISSSESDISTRPYAYGSSGKSSNSSGDELDLDVTVIESRNPATEIDLSLYVKKKWTPSICISDKATSHVTLSDNFDFDGIRKVKPSHSHQGEHSTSAVRSTERERKAVAAIAKSPTNSPQKPPPLPTLLKETKNTQTINAASTPAKTVTSESVDASEIEAKTKTDNAAYTHTHTLTKSNLQLHAQITSTNRQAVQNKTLQIEDNKTQINTNKATATSEKIKTTINKSSDNVGHQQQEDEKLDRTTPNKTTTSKKCILPMLLTPSKNDSEQAVQIRKPDEVDNVTEWLVRVPPLLPSELSLLHATPIKAVQRIESAAATEENHLTSSPYKRRRRINSEDYDDYEQSLNANADPAETDMDMLAPVLNTPAFKSKIANELHEEARSKKPKLKDDDHSSSSPDVDTDTTTQPNQVGGQTDMDIDSINASNNNIINNSPEGNGSVVKQPNRGSSETDSNNGNNTNVSNNNCPNGELIAATMQPNQDGCDDGGMDSDNNNTNINDRIAVPPPSPQQQRQQPMLDTKTGKNKNKIPMLFLPMVPDIMPLLNKLSSNPAVGKFRTTTTAKNGLRVQCVDMDSYNAIQKMMIDDKIPLHTHQPKINRGFRVIIRKLHCSTPCTDITKALKHLGYNVKFSRVMKQRITGKPLHLFELEIESLPNNAHLEILKIDSLLNQTVKVERMVNLHQPVQCHRCQAFGHTKNYCLRPFRCMKCAGDHISTSCKKPRQEKAKCVNCNEGHVSSYKGCIKFKEARREMRANKVTVGANNNNKQQQSRRLQQHYKHQLHQQRQDQRSQLNLQQQHHQQQQGNQTQSHHHTGNANTTARNPKISYSWIVRNGNGNGVRSNKNSSNNIDTTPQQQQPQSQPKQPQHPYQQQKQRQQRKNPTPGQNNKNNQQQQRQRQITPGRQQQQQHQRALKTPKPNYATANENARFRNKRAPNSPANNNNNSTLGPAGKHLAELQKKLREKQQQQQQVERQQHLHQRQQQQQQQFTNNLPQATNAPPVAAAESAIPRTTTLEQRDQLMARIEAMETKLDMLFEVLVNMINTNTATSISKTLASALSPSISESDATTANEARNV